MVRVRTCGSLDAIVAKMPERIGPYEVIDRLGAGGMAETYLGVRHGPGGFEQRVCVKRIRADLGHQPAFVRQFLDEARLAAKLRHANVVQVLDFGDDAQGYFLALELVEGTDLRVLLQAVERRQRRLAPSLVAWLGVELATALSYAHRAKLGKGVVGLVHRDISPSNVLISLEGEIKLADFGIARPVEGPRQTDSGVVKGKAPYMAPEYARTACFDARCDLFSLGVVLFECLAGRRPYDGHTDLETLERASRGQHVSLRALAPHAPQALVELVEQLVRPEPQARPATAAAVLEALLEHRPEPRGRQLFAALVEPARKMHAPSEGQAAMPPTATVACDVTPPAERRPPSSDVPARSARVASTRTRPAAQRRPLFAKRASRLLLALAALVSSLALGLWASRALRDSRADGDAASASAVTTDEGRPTPATPEPDTASRTRPLRAGTDASRRRIEPPSPTPATVSANVGRRLDAQAGSLTVVVIPFGHVAIDGTPHGPAPVTVSLSPGQHRVRVSGPHVQGNRTVRIEAGDETRAVFK